MKYALLSLLAAAALAQEAPPRSLGEDAPAMAESRYHIGVRLYQEGRYADAAREFKVGLDLYPKSARLAFNLGRARERAGQIPGAIEAYRLYLGLERDAGQRAEVERVIGALEAQLEAARGRLRLGSQPPGARVVVDGDPASAVTTPEVVVVAPGTHHLRAELAGYLPAEREVAAVAGEEVAVVFALEAPSGAWKAPTGWALLGIGLASAAVGGILYASAASTADEAEGLYGDPARYRALKDDFESAELGAWLSFGAGGALLAGGATLLALSPADEAVAATPGGLVARW